MSHGFPYVVSSTTTEEEYVANVFSLAVGDFFKFDSSVQFEDVYQRLTEYIPDTLETFDVEYAAPGTQMYAVWGHSLVVVTEKKDAPEE